MNEFYAADGDWNARRGRRSGGGEKLAICSYRLHSERIPRRSAAGLSAVQECLALDDLAATECTSFHDFVFTEDNKTPTFISKETFLLSK